MLFLIFLEITDTEELPADLEDLMFEDFDNLPAVNKNMQQMQTINHAPSFNNCSFHGVTFNFNITK